jgi:hypothetical protein
MTTFAKLPDGPVPQGGAGARSLTEVEWQRKVGADYVAHKKEGFLRVTGGTPVQYLSSGTLDGSPTNLTYGSTRYQGSFHRTSENAGNSCDFGYQYFTYVYGETAATTTAHYPGIYATDAGSNLTWTIYSDTTFKSIGRNYRTAVSEVPFSYQTYRLLSNSWLFNIPSAPQAGYWGQVDLGAGNGKEAKVISFYTLDNGRTDPQGRRLVDVVIRFTYGKSPSAEYAFPVYGRSDSDYGDGSCVVSSAKIYYFTYERFIWYGAISTSVDVRPRFWINVSVDGGTTWSHADIRAIALNDLDMPQMRVAQYTTSGPDGGIGFFNSTTIPLAADGSTTITDTTNYSHIQDYEISHGPPATYGTRTMYPFIVQDGDKYNANLTYIALAGKWVMLANNVALYAFPYRKTVGGSYVWAAKILKFDGTTCSVVYTSTTTGVSTEYIQHMIYVGNQTIIAKRAMGFNGTGFAVDMMKSTDNGGTWTPFTPTGFLCPLTNQYFGNFYLNRAEADPPDPAKPPVILIPSWDNSTGEYHVFSSKDYGTTWEKKGKIGKPNSFYRIDSMVFGDGGNCFQDIEAAMARTRKSTIDLALPTRYIRTP